MTIIRVYGFIAGGILLAILAIVALLPSASQESGESSKKYSKVISASNIVPELITLSTSPQDIWSHNILFGDYSEMVGRRIIRVLIPPGKTFFLLDKGQKRGLIYDNMMALERYVNKHLKSKHVQVKVVVIPTSRKHLIPYLLEGYGDIVAGNVTITEEREKLVIFPRIPLMN